MGVQPTLQLTSNLFRVQDVNVGLNSPLHEPAGNGDDSFNCNAVTRRRTKPLRERFFVSPYLVQSIGIRRWEIQLLAIELHRVLLCASAQRLPLCLVSTTNTPVGPTKTWSIL